ncbi:hypothetical protein, partial [Hymenobacter agri]
MRRTVTWLGADAWIAARRVAGKKCVVGLRRMVQWLLGALLVLSLRPAAGQTPAAKPVRASRP